MFCLETPGAGSSCWAACPPHSWLYLNAEELHLRIIAMSEGTPDDDKMTFLTV